MDIRISKHKFKHKEKIFSFAREIELLDFASDILYRVQLTGDKNYATY